MDDLIHKEFFTVFYIFNLSTNLNIHIIQYCRSNIT
uniref:Uncharacterized protein n=1 Tax=Heterorhabditis bacteriophora TaxID=37862 RepID=A0A1I7WDL0_HETBA